jgi:hypothetical protein
MLYISIEKAHYYFRVSIRLIQKWQANNLIETKEGLILFQDVVKLVTEKEMSSQRIYRGMGLTKPINYTITFTDESSIEAKAYNLEEAENWANYIVKHKKEYAGKEIKSIVPAKMKKYSEEEFLKGGK